MLLVQSAQYSPDYLEHRVNCFLEQFTQMDHPEEMLEGAKRALIHSLSMEPANLSEESVGHWLAILSGDYNFES